MAKEQARAGVPHFLAKPKVRPLPTELQIGNLLPSRSLMLLGRMKECPLDLVQSDCGCAGLARCTRGRGRQGLVNHHVCFDCLGAGSTP